MNDIARQWCESRTRDSRDFDPADLLRLKGSRRMSVVIPARDEAETIGAIVSSIRNAHLIGTGLVDEILVVDSDSVDDTIGVARSAGAVVHSAAAIRPELGWRPGKGEAMWKSLFVATGDIVVFVDGDLTSFSPDYVTGLLGPLLTEPGVLLVKAFYDRDLAGSPKGVAQGGRVTELMARPVINSWWPDLSRIVQPLSGEWAARRELLEALAFPSGYGIELASLVDTYEMHGLDAIAQVDLGSRAHVHQDLVSLGVLASEVLAAAEWRKFGDLSPRVESIAHPVRSSRDGSPEWVTRSINSEERPPHASLSARTPHASGAVAAP